MQHNECAFCGRAAAATQRVFCQPCTTTHEVCQSCADETAADQSLEVALLVA